MFENKGKWAKEYRKIDKDNVIVKNGKYYHKKYGYELDFKDGAFHKADVADNAQTRAINKKTNDLANKLDMNKDTHDLTDNTERQKLAKLQADYNKVLDAMDKLPVNDDKRKDFEKALGMLKNSIDMQKEIVVASHEVNSDKRRQAQIPKMLKTKESFYIDEPDDTSDLIDVIDKDGNKRWVSQQTYDKHRAMFQKNLSMHQAKQQKKTNSKELLSKAKVISDKIKKTSQQLKSSYGINADRLDKELSVLQNERDNIYKQLYGKTFTQLRNMR